ncbi:MAG: hypothetical protein WB562_20435 [Candidatus Sulfotelmatobacter sp.]
MGYTVRIEWEGLDGAISRFSQMGEQLNNNLEQQTESLAKGGKNAWDTVTPVRSGRLKGGNVGDAGGLTITFSNATYYYPFVDKGHRTPSYFHRHGRIVPAKRISHVAGRGMTEQLVEWLEGNVGNYLRKALDEFVD